MAEWSIAADLKSAELYRFREFESHSLLFLYLFLSHILTYSNSLFLLQKCNACCKISTLIAQIIAIKNLPPLKNMNLQKIEIYLKWLEEILKVIYEKESVIYNELNRKTTTLYFIIGGE